MRALGTSRLFLNPWRAIFLGIFLASAACNRPAEEPPPNELATSVAATLTAQPTALSTSILPTETLAPELDESTPEPSATPLDAKSTPTEGLPEESPTPSSTPIPLEPGDPRLGLNLSNPDYIDDFSQPFTWFEFSDPEAATVTREDGRLRVTDHVTDGILWWTTTALEATDSYAEIAVRTSACSGRDAYGMGIRVGGENIDRGYTLEITCGGEWRVRKFIAFDEIPAVLHDWTESDAIKIGPDVTNEIGFFASGNQMHAFVNAVLLNTIPIEDDDYTAGVPSLFTNAAQTADLTVHFDDFRLWHLPP